MTQLDQVGSELKELCKQTLPHRASQVTVPPPIQAYLGQPDRRLDDHSAMRAFALSAVRMVHDIAADGSLPTLRGIAGWDLGGNVDGNSQVYGMLLRASGNFRPRTDLHAALSAACYVVATAYPVRSDVQVHEIQAPDAVGVIAHWSLVSAVHAAERGEAQSLSAHCALSSALDRI